MNCVCFFGLSVTKECPPYAFMSLDILTLFGNKTKGLIYGLLMEYVYFRHGIKRYSPTMNHIPLKIFRLIFGQKQGSQKGFFRRDG